MSNHPRTKEEARKLRYGECSFSPGARYQDHQCAATVWRSGAYRSSQCSRKPGHGPGGLYCKQHAKEVEND